MTYEYTDHDGDKLSVNRSRTIDGVIFMVSGTTGYGVAIKDADAPAVALAILEAAGIDPDNAFGLEVYAADACGLLQTWKRKTERDRTEAQAREQEDAQVREYRTHSLAAVQGEFGNDDWAGLTDIGREGWRARYRAAREFFTRDEKPAPRVLNYGDPEPDRDTKWRDADCGIVRYFPENDGWGNTGGWPWEALGDHWFPMTEVL